MGLLDPVICVLEETQFLLISFTFKTLSPEALRLASNKISASNGQQPMKKKEHCLQSLNPVIPPPSQAIPASYLNFRILSIHIRKMGILMTTQGAVAKMTKNNTDETSTVAAHLQK